MQQLKALYGMGEALCEELIKVVRDHYRLFMRGEQPQGRGGN
jgi:hypothetical protein